MNKPASLRATSSSVNVDKGDGALAEKNRRVANPKALEEETTKEEEEAEEADLNARSAKRLVVLVVANMLD
jgi:hypothetical protein